jgi:hypothetical protein
VGGIADGDDRGGAGGWTGGEVGSLEAGKQADLILVDLAALNLSQVLKGPVRNIVPNLVYVASGHEVRTVMVAGSILVRDGVVLTADEGAIRSEAQTQAEALAGRVAADPVHTGMALLEAMQATYLLRSFGQTGVHVKKLPAFFVGEGAGDARAGQGHELLQIQGENL